LQLVIASAQPSASSNDFWSAGEGAVAEKIEIGTLDFLRAPSPPSAASDQTTKPLLLYIPGVDGNTCSSTTVTPNKVTYFKSGRKEKI